MPRYDLTSYPKTDNLRGWWIFPDAGAPVTGRWKARKFGVQMGAHSYDALCNMIRQKEDNGT